MPSIVDRGAGAAHTEDVVELILADHRQFEELLRALRNREADRDQHLADLADLLVAHAEAEEDEVYPELEREAPEDAEEIAHGAEEHADGHAALLALQRCDSADVDAFEEALEELSETLTHHLDEEERDVLNAAREEVDLADREALGRAFLSRRAELLEQRCGRRERVEELVAQAEREGLLD
ncbi:MAG: hemerythrin domain-containing protein [Nitriliruptoraceae bacterium]|nr:hemerythrin domain-containing protein [Nitriliruptoraceae bacterium]